MVDRMLMAENQFRISYQGFDVGTATWRQLAFSESYAGLIPAAKGSFSGSGSFALPEAGFVPVVLVESTGAILATINAAKTILTITVSGTGTASGRYVIFKNRQF